jgi:hypothetical protein
MSSIPQLGALDGCLDQYRRAYEQFGTDPFDVSRLARDSDGETDELEHALELLVAAGLVERTVRDRYRVRCTPEESVETWQEKAAPRLSLLHRRVQETSVDRGSRSTDDTETLTRDDEHFFGVQVTPETDVESLVDTLTTTYDEETYDGVVLRTRGNRADVAQRLADRLEGDDAGRADARNQFVGGFEKIHTDLVGDHKDALEFRLYLRRVT